jgi:Ca2+-binding RTX toxin-like protein
MSSRSASLVLVVAVAAALGGLLPSAASGGARTSCRVVADGPAGPRGDLLRIRERTNGVVSIDSARATGEIRVFSNSGGGYLDCAGPTPTVTSVDRLELRTNSTPFIDALGPGASRERAGSEIEIVVFEDYRGPVLNVKGTEEGETMVAGQLGARRIGVNVNSDRDGARQDADVTLVSGNAASHLTPRVTINGGKGADELSLLGGRGFSGKLAAENAALSGADGNDVLRGGPRADRFNGGEGNDRMLGGRGSDSIRIGNGRDFANGGKGGDEIRKGDADDAVPDRVVGGAGNDRIDTYFGGDVINRAPAGSRLVGDSVDCGRGRDVAVVDDGDRRRNCERVYSFPPGSSVDICGFRPCLAASIRARTSSSRPARISATGSGSPLTIPSKNSLRSW